MPANGLDGDTMEQEHNMLMTMLNDWFLLMSK